MLETIFGTLNSVLTALADTILSCFLDLMQLDLAYFVTQFPLLGSAYTIFQSIAVGIIILLAGYSLVKFFVTPANQRQVAPHTVFVRTLLALLMVFFGGYLFEEMVEIAKYPYQAFVHLGEGYTSIFTGPDGGFFSHLAVGNIVAEGVKTILAFPALFELIVSLVLLIVLFKSFFRLVVEILERYFLVGVLTFVSPLASSTLASPSTSQIFARYINMFVSQLLLMSLSVFSYNLALTALNSIANETESVAIAVQVMFVVAACKIGTRMDTYLQQLGLNAGVTGGGIADEMMGVAASTVHRVKDMVSGWNGGGGGDGTGHRADAVLGGVKGTDGSVKPEAWGTGVLGAGVTAARYGAAAAKNGGTKEDVFKAAKEGAKAGFGFSPSKDPSKNDISLLVGRKNNAKINQARTMRQENQTPATKANAGGFTMSGDRKTAHLDPTAQAKGVKLGKSGEMQGDARNVGRVMAANMGDKAAYGSVMETAKRGDPSASEYALFGTKNNMKYDGDNMDVSQRQFDQQGSEMLMATFGDGFEGLYNKAKEGELPQEEQNLNQVAGAIQNGRLSDFETHDVGKDGREVTATMKDDKGQTIGSVTAMDEKGYNQLTDEQKRGFVPIKSATGATYYMRASGTAASADGTPQTSKYGEVTPISGAAAATAPGSAAGATPEGNSTPGGQGGVRVDQLAITPDTPPFEQRMEGMAVTKDWQEAGVSVDYDDAGTQIIGGDDFACAGAALNRAVSSDSMAENKLATDTINSPNGNPEIMTQSLINPECGNIPAGSGADAARVDGNVAGMVNTAFGADTVGEAAGRVQSMPAADVAQLAPSIRAASGERINVPEGYSTDNYSVEGGKTKFDYHTPSGSYRVEMSEVDPSGGPAQGSATFTANSTNIQMTATPMTQAQGVGGGPAPAPAPSSGGYGNGGEAPATPVPAPSPAPAPSLAPAPEYDTPSAPAPAPAPSADYSHMPAPDPTPQPSGGGEAPASTVYSPTPSVSQTVEQHVVQQSAPSDEGYATPIAKAFDAEPAQPGIVGGLQEDDDSSGPPDGGVSGEAMAKQFVDKQTGDGSHPQGKRRRYSK